ncbi:hypothetical protein FJD37_02215 [Pseudomonas saxonica]|uniref:Uncharacterized protein n=1 Tax=Pseudomonas saxonica TaxID=2600598 RepID=A0A5C5Q4U0_9PSED|nr:hypothetical protein FJD37_02215 [Pseudomonas saxonica]
MIACIIGSLWRAKTSSYDPLLPASALAVFADADRRIHHFLAHKRPDTTWLASDTTLPVLDATPPVGV